MTKREISRLIESPLPGALLNSITEDIGKCRFHQSMDSLALRMGFLVPLQRVVQGVGNPLSHDTFIELSLADLKEETADPCTTIGKVLDLELFTIKRIEEGFCNLLHPVEGLSANLLQLSGILFEESRLTHLPLNIITDSLVFVFEDGTSKLFDLSDDIPTPVVGDVFHDITHQPLEQEVGDFQVVDHLVNRQFLHLYIVETDTEVGREIEFAGQIA